MKKKKLKKVRAEKLLYVLLIITVILGPMGIVFTKALVSETNIEVEQLKSKISSQENTNDSLSMQIDELASLDKIQEVAFSKGLTYNNENIKVITEE